MRASVRLFMIPDFNELRKQSGHGEDAEFLKPSPDSPSSDITSSQQFETKCDHTQKKTKRRRSVKAFKSVPETNNRFLALWVYRYDFIFAPILTRIKNLIGKQSHVIRFQIV